MFLSASLLTLKDNFTKWFQEPGSILNISVVSVMIFFFNVSLIWINVISLRTGGEEEESVQI